MTPELQKAGYAVTPLYPSWQPQEKVTPLFPTLFIVCMILLIIYSITRK